MAEAGAGVRPATPADNAALLALSTACPMEGDVGLCVDRAPDFFALNRLEGEDFEVGVVDGPGGTPVGCIAVAERRAYLNGSATRTMYVGDLKVLPEQRGGGAADRLSEWARDWCRARGGDDVPTLVTVLAGNRSMQRRLAGARGLPHLHHFATIRSHSVSLLWRRRPPRSDLRIARGSGADAEEMAALWREVAPGRQFAGVHDAESLATWISVAPGLDFSSYLLARRPDGRLAGFLALWDQESFKQLRVTSYSRRLAAFRAGFNAVGPTLGATRLPPAGGQLRNVTAVHVCVPGTAPEVLRALLVGGYNELRGRDYSFFTVGLDVKDPLTAACRGLLAQPTDVWACRATLTGEWTGPPLDDRPLHHEIALV